MPLNNSEYILSTFILNKINATTAIFILTSAITINVILNRL